MLVWIFSSTALRKERVIQILVLGYPLSLVSKAAPYLASIFGGTFPHVLSTEPGKPNSDAASSGKKEVPLDASNAQIFLCR